MKKKLHLLILFFTLQCSLTVEAQFQNGLWVGKEAYNWHFGFHAGVTFNTNPPTAITDSAIDGYPLFLDNNGFPVGSTLLIEGTGSISDADGNILFYTNGKTVWNANNEIMLNGQGLETEISTYQTGLIVPAPRNPNIYYIFSSGGANTTGAPMVYSEVDMSLDGGLGAVTENKNIQIAAAVEERMTAVHHADGERVWVVFQNFNTYEITSYLVSSEGVNPTPVVSHMGTVTLWAGQGAMKISPDGSKMVMNRLILDTYYMEIFNFDNATGQVTELVTTIDYNDIPGNLAGILAMEFSPNNRFLYGVSAFEGTVHQFDLEAGSGQDIKDSRTVVYQSQADSYFFMQSAPDGKIYLSSFFNGAAPLLSVINYPNNKGIASGFAEDSFSLSGSNQSSLPCFIQSYFESGILHEGGKCQGDEILFSTLRIPGIESIVWDFGDPNSGDNNTSTALEPTHAFSSGGTFTITALITSNGAQQTATTQVTVLSAPDAVKPTVNSLTQCSSTGNAVFDLTELDAQILNGQDVAIFIIKYYANEADITLENPITASDSFSTGGQTIFAKITNTTTGCSTVVSFDLVVNTLSQINTPGDLQQCSDSQTAQFNLTQQNQIILGNQDPSNFEISYYASESDVDTNNPITTPESYNSSGQVIYVHVANTVTGCVSEIVEFQIAVQLTSLASDVLDLVGCSPINLNEVASKLQSGLILSYYTQEGDAVTGENPITDVQNYIVKDEDTIYVRAEDTEGCADVYRIQLNQENCKVPKGISPNGDGMNDTFDLTFLDVVKLTVLNRYGKEVYSRLNYTNEWSGQSDSGKNLPTGTYFYMLELNNGEHKTGWVYINREL